MNDIDKFLKISKVIGKDFSLIQGPGGNTSLKINNKINIKKTGTYLKNSTKQDIFIEENLDKLQVFYKNRNDNKKYRKDLSIEAPLHIIFNHRFVFHYHSILSIILSVSKELKEIKNICKNLKIEWIPYKRPGIELANEISKISFDESNYNFFLQNHGMLIASNDIDKVLEEIYNFEKLFLEIIGINKKSLYQKVELEKVRNDGFYEYKFKSLDKNKIINDRIFFPDHAVFANFKFKDIEHLNEKNKDKIIYLNNQNFVVKRELSDVEIEILSIVLTIYVSSLKLHNYIPYKDAFNLVTSDDEKLRIERNK
jgi:ribulose-5-phosphate 4-epimerase/fuculose-1-phosphate aldolase